MVGYVRQSVAEIQDGEEGGTMVHQVEYSSISSGWTTGIKATKGDSGDTITAYGFTVTKQ